MFNLNLPESIIEEQSESFIMFPKNFLNDYEYEGRDLDICNLAIIKSLANNFTKAAITSVNNLVIVRGMSSGNKASLQATRESLVRLQALNYIVIYEDKQKTKPVINLKTAQSYFINPTNEYEDCFAKVFESDLEKILSIKSNYKAKLFSVYLAIVTHLFYHKDASQNHKSVWATIETLAKMTNLDRKTVMKYIKQLHEKEVLFCITTKVELKKNKNFYGRFSHRELITREAIENTEVLRNSKFKDISAVIGLEL